MSFTSQALARGQRIASATRALVFATLIAGLFTSGARIASAEERFVIAAPPPGGSAVDYEAWLALSRRAQKLLPSFEIASSATYLRTARTWHACTESRTNSSGDRNSGEA